MSGGSMRDLFLTFGYILQGILRFGSESDIETPGGPGDVW